MLSRRTFLEGSISAALLSRAARARNPRGSTNGTVSATYKWNPGDYALAQKVYGIAPSDAVSDWGIINSASTTGFKGYVAGFNWYALENSTSSTSPNYTFTNIWQIFLYMQAVWPNSHYGIYLNGNHYGQNITSTAILAANLNQSSANYFIPGYILNCGGSVQIPNYYGSGSSTTYPVARNCAGASTYGLNFQAINGGGTAFTAVSPQWYNPGVTQAFINMIQALSQSTCPAPTAYSAGTTYSAGLQVTYSSNVYTYINATAAAGNVPTNTTYWKLSSAPYAGYTLDAIPLVEYIAINDEVSYGFVGGNYSSGGQNFASGSPSVNAPTSVSGATPSNTNFWIQHINLLTSMTSFFPHTMIGSCDTYGYGASSYGTDSGGNVAANVNGNIPGTYRSAASALSSIRGLALSGADSYGYDFYSASNYANSAKQGWYGIQAVGAQGAALPTPAYSNLQNVMPYVAQVQPTDYKAAGPGYYNATQVTSIMSAQAIPGASHRIWCLTDDYTSGGGWAGGSGYIYNTIIAQQGTYPVNTTLPSNL